MQANTSTATLYVPIDVGMNVDCYGVYAGERLTLILPAVTVRNTLPGYTPRCKHLAIAWQTLYTNKRSPTIRIGGSDS
jgi:hypothetical protein